MKNNYEILDGKLYFHKGLEIKQFDLFQVIEELERMTDNLIEVQDGILKEYISSEDYLSSEEMEFAKKSEWVNVEIWQIEGAVGSLTRLKSKTIELDYEEIHFIELLLNDITSLREVVYGKEKESILNKLKN